MSTRFLCAMVCVLGITAFPIAAHAVSGFPYEVALWSGNETLSFGQYVALRADTLAVTDETACPSNSLETCSSVFVFEKLLGAWTEVALLTVNAASSEYGYGVAISSDESTIALAAPYVGAAANGAVYVFQKPAGGWHDMTQSATLTIPGNVGSNLGISLVIDGNTIFASFYNWCGGTSNSACTRIAVYPEPSGGWTDSSTPTAVLNYSGEGSDIYIGNQVTASGGYLITNLGNYPAAPTALNLLVFAQPAGGWVDATETSQILPPSGFNNSLSGFGSQLSLAGMTLAVPATNGNFMILVYQEPPSGWGNMSPAAELTPPAISNGITSLFASSPSWVATGGTSATSSLLYLFQKPASGWVNSNTPDQTLSIPTPNNGSGARTVAMTDSAVAVSSTGQTCPTELSGSLNACSLVYLYDSAALPATADPVMQISVQGGFAVTGSPATFDITVSNQGAAAAGDFQLTGALPVQLSSVQATSSQGSCQIAAGMLTCNLGSLLAGSTATVNLTATAPSTAQYLSESVDWSTSSPVRSLRHTQAAITYWVDSPPTVGNLAFTEYCCGLSVQGTFAGHSDAGENLTYKVVNPPTHGELDLVNLPAGDFIYTPDAGFVGTDSFTYVANDGYTNSTPGTVTLTFQPAPKAPAPPPNNPLRAAAGALDWYADFFIALLLLNRRWWKRVKGE